MVQALENSIKKQVFMHQQSTHNPQNNVLATIYVSQQHATWHFVSICRNPTFGRV